MTTITVELPDDLVQEATVAGLLSPDKLDRILRDRLRSERLDKLSQTRSVLAAEPLPSMTPAEINAEISAYRSEQARAAGH